MEYSDFIKSIWKPGKDIDITPEKAELLHAALLVSGEAAELLTAESSENAVEELGDLFFAAHTLDNLLPALCPMDYYGTYQFSTPVNIVGCAGEITDLIKKHVIYGQRLDIAKLDREFNSLLSHLRAYCKFLGWTPEDVIDVNRAKLTKRYPGGYSDAAAKVRADKGGDTHVH